MGILFLIKLIEKRADRYTTSFPYESCNTAIARKKNGFAFFGFPANMEAFPANQLPVHTTV